LHQPHVETGHALSHAVHLLRATPKIGRASCKMDERVLAAACLVVLGAGPRHSQCCRSPKITVVGACGSSPDARTSRRIPEGPTRQTRSMRFSKRKRDGQVRCSGPPPNRGLNPPVLDDLIKSGKVGGPRGSISTRSRDRVPRQGGTPSSDLSTRCPSSVPASHSKSIGLFAPIRQRPMGQDHCRTSGLTDEGEGAPPPPSSDGFPDAESVRARRG